MFNVLPELVEVHVIPVFPFELLFCTHMTHSVGAYISGNFLGGGGGADNQRLPDYMCINVYVLRVSRGVCILNPAPPSLRDP